MKHTLEVDGIILEFGSKRVLQDVYMKCETGKVSGMLGRNGTGKSSLMQLIYGQLHPVDQSIRLDGKAILSDYRHPNFLRFLPQFSFIPNDLKVKHVFRDFDLEFERFIEYFPGFKQHYGFSIASLSGGEARLIEIYAILVSKAMFCMLDEPFSQLMPAHVETIKRLIIEQKASKGILVTDHLYEHILAISDEVQVISNGKMHLMREAGDLLKHGYVRDPN